VKTRLGDAGEGHLGPQAIGVLGLWRKWSFPLALSAVSWATPGADLEGEREVTSGVPALERWLVPGSAWISVEKERRLQRYRLSGDMAATAVPMGTPTGLGCEFELSRLRAGGEEWWSVCFEAFGSEPGLERALMAVATQVLGLGWPLPLDVEHSLSYPSWLACFAARVEPPNH
jgi:hypothetical protein